MLLNYPGSFFRLLLAGFMLAVLPLLLGLINDHLAIKRLAAQSQQAVYDAARIAHSSRELNDTAISLERAAQQHAILQEPSLQEALATLSARFKAAARRLAALPLGPESRRQLDALLREEATLERAWMQAPMAAKDMTDTQTDTAAALALADRYADISLQSRRLLEHSSALIEREAASLRQLASQTERRIGWQLFWLLPLSLLLASGFAWLLARPIRQLSQAIRELGERHLDAPVRVDGPADLEHLGAELDWLRQRLLHLEAQKSQFLRHVSHELKTPLTALREGSELLAEEIVGPLSPRQQEIVRILRQGSLDLQHQIEALLRHGEAEYLLGQVEPQQVQLASLMRALLRRHQLAYAARGLRIRLQLEELSLWVDVNRLRVILDNLLSNAIKFSPEEAEILITAHGDEATVVISVRDQGPGVSPTELDQIFEPFQQGWAKAHGSVAGSGLGLSIARDHAQALGGRLAVHASTEANQGGWFVLYLPRRIMLNDEI